MEELIVRSDFIFKFGEHLKKMRIARKFSYRKLSQNCELDYSNIRKIEKGERNIQLTSVLELAKGLGVHPKELFDFPID